MQEYSLGIEYPCSHNIFKRAKLSTGGRLFICLVWALAAEGRKNSLPVFVDQPWRNGSLELAAGGIAAFAHTPDFIFCDDALGMLKEHGVMFISTLAVRESKSRRRLEDLAFLDQSLDKDTTPPDFIAALREDARPARESKEWNAGPREQNLKRFQQQSVNLKRLYDAGRDVGLEKRTVNRWIARCLLPCVHEKSTLMTDRSKNYSRRQKN